MNVYTALRPARKPHLQRLRIPDRIVELPIHADLEPDLEEIILLIVPALVWAEIQSGACR
jgi:hypothetical protein